MNLDVVLWLLQDGMTNGAVYALLALALLLVFSVSRVIFVPQGEFIAYAGMSLATLQAGHVPGIVYVALGGGVIAAAMEIVTAVRERSVRRAMLAVAGYVLLPATMAAITYFVAPMKLSPILQIVLIVGFMLPLGPIVYRIAFQPIAKASVLVLFLASIAVHYILQGIGLIVFGGEGLRASVASEVQLEIGLMSVSSQTLLVLIASFVIMLGLWLFMGRSLYGNALRATAFNRVGARLVGIRPEIAGAVSMLLAAFIGTVSGVLIAPLTTLYYDTGFLIGLKGFIGAILGGMASFPLAVIGALGLGVAEAFASFASSAFKETIVFSIIIPPLIWLSLRSSRLHDEDEDA